MEYEGPFSVMENLLINLYGEWGKLIAWLEHYQRYDPDQTLVSHRQIIFRLRQINTACLTLEDRLTSMPDTSDIEEIRDECLLLSNHNYFQTRNFLNHGFINYIL